MTDLDTADESAPPSPTGDAADPPVYKGGLFSSLTIKPYRHLFLNALLSFLASGFQMITLQAFVIDTLTAQGRAAESVKYVGLVPLAGLLPLFLFSMFGGVLADRVDRKRLILLGQILRFVVGAALTVMYFTGDLTIWIALGLVFVLGTVQALTHPPRLAMLPGLVPEPWLLNAVAVMNLAQHSTMIAGPVLAGIIIKRASVGHSLAVHTVFYVLALIPIIMLEVPEAAQAKGGGSVLGAERAVLHEIADGFRLCWNSRLLRALLFCSFVMGVCFIGPFTALVPLLARDVMGSDVQGQGYMSGVMGLGMIVGGIAVGRSIDIANMGRKSIYVLMIGGATWFCIGSTRSMNVAMPLMFFWGLGGGVFLNFNQTLTQRLAPDEIRGRIMSINMLLTQGAGPLGNLLSTALATSITALATWASLAEPNVIGVERTVQLSGLAVVAAMLALVFGRVKLLEAD